MKKPLVVLVIIFIAALASVLWLFPGQESSSNIENVKEPPARESLSSLCVGVLAVERNAWDAAYREFSELAVVGEPVAQYYLGTMFARGYGVVKDSSTGMRWLMKAAEQNYPRAMFELGLLAYQGQVSGKNYSEAFHWFERAAKLNHPEAQLFLGSMHLNGRGTEVDLAVGHAWLSVALENGFVPAADVLANRAEPPNTAVQLKVQLQNSIADTVRQSDIPRGPQCAQ
ncbi:tetratricopeptide repeat protein [Marinobacter sp. W-8]|uniref:tetratricopeptide repeat protein n=1 Tax=Marinobacter sp. W-8 TaxID=3369658 RepID=UPI0037C5EE74